MLFDRAVQIVHVRLVMLVVVQLHRLGVDMRFQRRVVIGKRWEFVCQSNSSWRCWLDRCWLDRCCVGGVLPTCPARADSIRQASARAVCALRSYWMRDAPCRVQQPLYSQKMVARNSIALPPSVSSSAPRIYIVIRTGARVASSRRAAR